MDSRAQIVACARHYIGVRFAHQGRTAATGLDCLGLLIVAAKDAGIVLQGNCPTLLDDRRYGARPDTVNLQRQLGTFLDAVDTPQMGDVLLLRIEGRAQHLALVGDYPERGELSMIHAYAVARRVVEHRLDTAWREAIAGIYRLRN